MDWRTVGEVLLTAFLALQSWLLKRVWDSKPSREEVRKMFEEFEAHDDERDKELLKTISDQMAREIAQRNELHRENVRQQELMRSEARSCFKDVTDRIDTIYELMTQPRARGH